MTANQPAKPPAKLCSHLDPQGQPCRSVAVAGSALCRFHRSTRECTRRQRHTARIIARREDPTHLGPLATRAAVLHGLSRVARAVAAGNLDRQLAAALLSRLEHATSALDRTTPWFPASPTGSTPWTSTLVP